MISRPSKYVHSPTGIALGGSLLQLAFVVSYKTLQIVKKSLAYVTDSQSEPLNLANLKSKVKMILF